jgi:uncharacterized membrane protein YhaH (DUF805 family)
MDIGNLLFNPNGRIGQKDFWIGVAIIFGGNLLLTWIPFLGTLIWLGLLWVGVAVYGKRLHDAGNSAWLHAVPWGVSILLGVIGSIMLGGVFIAAMAGEGDVNMGALIAGGGMASVFFLLSTLVWVAYTIWVGVLKSDAGANAYGPAPVIDAAAAPVEPAASADAPTGAETGESKE